MVRSDWRWTGWWWSPVVVQILERFCYKPRLSSLHSLVAHLISDAVINCSVRQIDASASGRGIDIIKKFVYIYCACKI